MADTADEMMYLIDEEGRFQVVNDAFVDFFGMDKKRVIGMTATDLAKAGVLPEEMLEQRQDAISEFLRSDELQTTIEIEQEVDATRSFESRLVKMGPESQSFVTVIRDVTERKERERRLQTQEIVMQRMNEVALLIDGDKRIRFANDAALNFTDLPLEAIKGRPIGPITEAIAAPDENPQRFLDAIDALLDDVEPDVGEWVGDSDESDTLSLEFDLYMESFGAICAEQRIVPVELYDGERGIAVISRDITKRREKEREVQTHLRQAQKIGRVGSWAMELDTGNLELSDECSRILGLEPGTPITYDQFLEMTHPEDRARVDKALNEALKDGSGDVEHRILIDGETRWIHQTAEIKFDADGEPIEGIGVLQDTTEQRERERKVIEQKRRYESLFNSIRDPIVVTDTDGRVMNANPGFTDVFGRELDDIRGEEFGLLSTADDESRELVPDDEATGVSSSKVRVDYRKHSGQEFPAESTISRFLDHEGDVIGYINHIRDISEREKNRQQLQVLDRVLRHNIKNDMNAIVGHAEMIRMEASSPIQPHVSKISSVSEKFIETAEKQQRITTLLTDPSESTVRDVIPMITSVVSELREHYPVADVDANLPEECRANVTHEFAEAINELLVNAVIHSDKDQPTVDIAFRTEDDIALIDIIDDGPGIPEPEWGVLAQDGEIDPLYHGSGLGLWFVHEVVRQSDGQLSFEENSSGGSTVTIRLPAE